MIDRIIAQDLAELRLKILEIMTAKKYFQCDICTGNYKVTCGDTDIVCPPEQAFDFFNVYFGDKCMIHSGSRISRISGADLKSLFRTIGTVVTYNSRKEMFDAIPKWDGIPRIQDFMRVVFECNANWHFFLLFMTAIVGKMADPQRAYVPFFFDFVGKKGVGKTLLHTLLVGQNHVIQVEPTSRTEEVLAQIYSHNAIIAVDDEGNLTANNEKGGWSEDKLKSFITRTEDVFSRKFMMAERRVRSFVFVRTSNEVKSSTDPDERRQIIFESRLPPRTCRLFKYGKENFQQLLAEAKAYFIKKGVYQLTPEDWADVTKQQAMYFNDETSYYVIVRKYVRYLMAEAKFRPDTLKLRRINGHFITQWVDFENYRINELHSSTVINGRLFWKIMRGLEAKGEPIRIREGQVGSSNIMFAELLVDQEPNL